MDFIRLLINEKGLLGGTEERTADGKTGTSQVVRIGSDKFTLSVKITIINLGIMGFVSFTHKESKSAVSVVVEHGCHGSSAAAPVPKLSQLLLWKNITLS